MPLEQRLCPRCAADCGADWGAPAAVPVEDEAHYWAECPALAPARRVMLGGLEAAYPGFGARFAALSRGRKAAALAFAVPDGTWERGAPRAVWAAGVRAVVRFGWDAALLCPQLERAMWRMGS